MPKQTLADDFAVLEAHRKEWANNHAGEYVLIGSGRPAGFFNDYASAFKAGLEKFGVQAQFLVKQVWVEEPVFYLY